MPVRTPSLLVLTAVAAMLASCAGEELPAPPDDDTGVDRPMDTADASETGVDSGEPTDSSDGGDPDTGDADAGDPVERTQCGPLPSAPSGELCQVSSGSSDWLLLRADVLTDGKIYENGSVLVDRRDDPAEIACTGCNCKSQTGGPTPTVVSCVDGVLSPGLINPHDHLGWATVGPKDHGSTRYNHRHEWRTGARQKMAISTPSGSFSREPILHGELRHLFGGATSIAGSTRGSTPEGLLRNLDTPDATEGLDVRVEYSTFPLGDVDGTLLDNGCDYNNQSSNGLDPYTVLRNDIYLPHIAEGIDKAAKNEYECLSTPGTESRDLVEDRTSIVHGIGMTAEDVREFGTEGGQLVWSPRTNISLYGQTADVLTYRRFDVPIALGTDWPVSGSMNMLRELACVRRLNRTRYGGAFSDRDLWRMATLNGARALGVADRIGRLQKGYLADIALFGASDARNYRAVVGADASDVHLVLRGGTPLYGDESIVDRMLSSSESGQCSRVNVCGDRRRVCVELDTSDDEEGAVTYQALKSAAGSGAYPLFACDASNLDEPTCRPSRPGSYDGTTSSSDSDGDGLAGGEDICPAVFNPVRPLEGGQPDADGDDLGDVCDACPTDKGESCAIDDWDGDGIDDDQDNCPFDPNSNQTDSDGDAIGDACDPSTTIYAIRNGQHGPGTRVQLDDVVVTGVRKDDPGFWVQVPTGAARYNGPENSGIFVFLGSPPVPSRGDTVDITGRVSNFHGRQQISGVTEVTVQSSGSSIPSPTTVPPCTIATGGSKASSLRGVLVKVGMVEVTDANPDAPNNDFGEFAVGNCSGRAALRIDDALHAISPDPEAGDRFQSLTGPLYYSFGNTKIEPRDKSDVVFGPAKLKNFDPGTAYLKAGTTGVPKPNLEIVLDRPSSTTTTVNLNYPNSSKLSGPSSVPIPAGTLRKSISLTGNQASTSKTDFAKVEASIAGGSTMSAKVLVYDDTFDRNVDKLATPTSTISTSSSFKVTATLDIPASSGGDTLNLSTSSDLNLPSPSPSVSADAFSTTFTVGSGSNTTQKTLAASVDGSGASLSVTVKSGPVGNCLIISEYIEGSGSNNKALELYNCGTTNLQLSNFGVCVAFNSASSCTDSATLGQTTLKPDEVYGICRSKTGTSGDPVAGIKNNCDEEVASVVNFNGNDRLLVFEDKNGDGAYNAPGDAILDQFGQLSSQPSGSPWKDTTERRCKLTPYLGQSSFKVSNYYNSFPIDDASDYGTAPSSTVTCP